jgi:PAS domain S-box-containing protein
MFLLTPKNIESKELLDLIPGNICVLDDLGKITYTNTSWKEFYRPGLVANFPGLIIGADYLEESARWKIISEEQITGVRSVLTGVLPVYEAAGSFHYLEEEKWFLLKVVPYLDMKGCIVLMFDVTDTKIAEEKNIVNEAILKSLIDNSPAIVYMKDMSGKYTHVNKMFEQVIGIKKEDIIGKKPYEVFPWDVADRFVKNDRKVIGTLTPLVLEEQFCVDETMKTFHSIQFPLRGEEGEPIGIAGISSDFTDRKLAEEELHKYKKELEESLYINEERLQLIFEANTVGIWDWNLTTNEVFFNPNWLKSLGYQPGELKPHSFEAFLDTVHPEDQNFVHEAIKKSIQEKKPYEINHRIIAPDGSIRIVHDKSKVFYDLGGNPERVIGTVCDITERKTAEASLRKSGQQLRSLSNKLQSVREEEKKRISREIHDELGQTLTAIKLDLTWLEKRMNVSEPSMIGKIKSIYTHLEDCFETVRRVSTELRPQVLDVMGFCEALQWQAEKFKENTDIKFELNIKPDGIRLESELSTDLFRIFQEALTNVSRHSRATNVLIDFIENTDNYELCVKDDGVGIHNSRVDHSNSLGLLGMRERALIWKGQVEIMGVVGEGTQLKIIIPKVVNDQ